MKRVLFLYATKNSGHKKAADAIRKSLTLIDPLVKTSGIDFFTHHYPHLGPFIFRMYVDLMQSIPHVWDYLYDHPDVASATHELRRFLNLLNIPKLHTVLRDSGPDAIVCTQAVPAGFIAREKQKKRIAIPLFVTVTDFVANPFWPTTHIDGYFVPHEEIKKQLIDRGVADKQIHVTGIPIDDTFAHLQSKKSIRERLRIRQRIPTVLVMGGSHGLGHIGTVVRHLTRCSVPLHVIVVAGHNRALHRSLTKQFADHKSIMILGLTKSVADLMDASDIVISKPGGLTSSEALAKGLPMIMVSPLPGQEERNAEFLVRHGAAIRCNTIEAISTVITDLLRDPLLIRRMKSQALFLAKPYASMDAANHILHAISLLGK
jgi:processive 1,2-diacylglycerol beta-glucosyltransferase